MILQTFQPNACNGSTIALVISEALMAAIIVHHNTTIQNSFRIRVQIAHNQPSTHHIINADLLFKLSAFIDHKEPSTSSSNPHICKFLPSFVNLIDHQSFIVVNH
jgi:hypothetical protein